MALLKAQEVRMMSADDRQRRLVELRGQLMNERGIAAMGGSPPSPGKIRQIRTAIARILTIQNQARQNGIQWAKGETPKAPTQQTPQKPIEAVPNIARPSAQARVNAQRFKARHAAIEAAKRPAAPVPKKTAPAAKKSQASKPKAAAHKAAPPAHKKAAKKEE
jgi:large subunit ribosomal protein L29